MQFKKIIFIVLVVFNATIMYGQELTHYNNYISNQGLLNPAYNGTRDVISGILLHRSQWVGFKGAPTTEALNIHGAIEQTRLGFGGIIVHDKVGLHRNFEIMGAASYKLPINSRGQFLSFGLQLGLLSYVASNDEAVISNHGDPACDANRLAKLGAQIGFGSYYYAKKYFAGFSIPRMFVQKFNETKSEYRNTFSFNDLHMFLYGGYVFDWDDVLVKPTGLMKFVPGAPLQFDFTCNVLLGKAVWAGLSYRTTSSVVVMAEYIINRQFTVRYSCDFAFNSTQSHAKYGSHEIGVQFDFVFNKRAGMRSIRYF